MKIAVNAKSKGKGKKSLRCATPRCLWPGLAWPAGFKSQSQCQKIGSDLVSARDEMTFPNLPAVEQLINRQTQKRFVTGLTQWMNGITLFHIKLLQKLIQPFKSCVCELRLRVSLTMFVQKDRTWRVIRIRSEAGCNIPMCALLRDLAIQLWFVIRWTTFIGSWMQIQVYNTWK